MASEAIGRMKCPVCGSKRARVAVSAKGLCCVTCNACHMQLFCRSNYSDTLVRQSMTPEDRVREIDAAAPKPPEPGPGMEIPAPDLSAVVPEQSPEPVPAPAPKKRGLLDW